MRTTRLFVAVGALVAAGAIAIPSTTPAFVTLGFSLPLTERHFRIFNNFTSPNSNNNTVGNGNYPGSLGAHLAIWKGAAEWGAVARGDGTGDGTQPVIGDGGANFDFNYQGTAAAAGVIGDNIVSATGPGCGGACGGITEWSGPPATNGALGWRIRINEPDLDWDDAPGAIAAADFDIQSTTCHEFGHALGLGHSVGAGCTRPTMVGGPVAGDTCRRSIEQDDIDGIQAVYSAAGPLKPTVVALFGDTLAGGSITVRFSGNPSTAANDTEVWFTDSANDGSEIVVLDTATASTIWPGTFEVALTIPAGAADGDIMIHSPAGSAAASSLSNAFPFNVGNDYTFVFIPHTADFEGGGADGYTTSGLWHIEDECAAGVPIPANMGGGAMAYNSGPPTFDYAVGTTTGTLTSPYYTPILLDETSVSIRFDYLKVTEGGGGATFDQCFVETSQAGVDNWSTLLQVTGNRLCAGGTQTVTALQTGVSGGNVRHRFRFNSVDSVANNFLGWYVDNVVTGVSNTIVWENFERGVSIDNSAFLEMDSTGGALTPTLWHTESTCDGATALPASFGGFCAAYNQGDLAVPLYTFNTGLANEGSMVSDPTSTALPSSAENLALQFDYLFEGEGGTTFDQALVEARDEAADPWVPIYQTTIQRACGTTPGRILITGNPALNSLIGGAFSIGAGFRFRFDTGDGINNNYLGWLVDNVQLTTDEDLGLSFVGQGCPGSGGFTPSIGVLGSAPYIGNLEFAITADQTLGGAASLLNLGISDTTWLAIPLPLNLAFLNAPNCNLAVSPDFLFAGSVTGAGPGGGFHYFTAGLPNDPSLVGGSLFVQWSIFDAGAPNALGLAMSRGMKVTVQG